MSSLVCVLAAEAFLWLFAPVSDPYERFKYSQHIASELPPEFRVYTEAEEGISGVQGRNLFSTNKMGFRGDDLSVPKPPGEFRIFMVGGSTTECFYLDDADAIHSVLQRELAALVRSTMAVKVYNAGKSGDHTDDHLSMIAHRIVHLEPDMIVVFSGLNDLLASIANYDYLHYRKETERLFPSSFLLNLLATEFQIPRRVYMAMKGGRAASNPSGEEEIFEQIPIKSNTKEKVEACSALPTTDASPRTDLRAYQENLTTIAGLCKAHNIRLVFLTQQTTWNSKVDTAAKDWQWLLCRGDVKYRENTMDDALESVNNVMRRVGAEQKIPVYDVVERIPKSLEYFYDDCHFNVKGARELGSGLAAFLADGGLIGETERSVGLTSHTSLGLNR